MHKLSHFVLIVSILLSISFVQASDSCSLKEVPPDKIRSGLQASRGLEKWLDQSGADVLVIARHGQSLAQYNIQFSHAAFVKKNPKNGRWVVYHQLNECPKDSSSLYEEGLGMFFMNNPQSFKAAALVPEPKIQKQLASLLEQPEVLKTVYDSRYNAAAYPFTLENQNSNGWIIELFAKAVAEDQEITNRKQAQQWLEQAHYQPSVVKIGRAKRSLAHAFVGNVSLTGHPKNLLNKGQVWLNSADSVLNFMARYSVPVKNCVQGSLSKGVCMIDTSIAAID
ncbi:DUF2145 domain-containing protein [Neisseria sp. Ec49-e6-T10]|uniref:DUF2145 domain-containing protein n=1 Tax=Neisseria sp. Ec49-e6-T10 TaxID=3140744 RepID=UPI003EBB4555